MTTGKPDDRNCGNCACSHIIEKPKLMPAGMRSEEWDAIPNRQMVCRLNPPLVAMTAKGRALMQMPTAETEVCWHWKANGTLPGD